MLTISKQPSTIVTQMQNTEKHEKWKEEEKKNVYRYGIYISRYADFKTSLYNQIEFFLCLKFTLNSRTIEYLSL